MKISRYQLGFVTPAFLGNASQQAQWRTPPIKALLRQWWRVAYARQSISAFDLAAMRREEALLFGHAWLEDDYVQGYDGRQNEVAARQSNVRLRLLSAKAGSSSWSAGTQTGVQPMSTDLGTSYAWFGLVKRRDLPDRNAIKAEGPESQMQIALAAPEQAMPLLHEAIALANAFGTMGARSRGAWGSLHIAEARSLSATDAARYAQPLEACLRRDWAMAMAQDTRGLCAWHSKETFRTWDKAMAFVAMARRQVRGAVDKSLRPALGFAGTGRMPSPMRWKVVPDGDALRVRIFAMPHAIPVGSGESLTFAQLLSAWRTVCAERDDAKNVIRWTTNA